MNRHDYSYCFLRYRQDPEAGEFANIGVALWSPFKHAWKNGIWNVYETLSFDLLDADSIEKKAHTWFGRSVHLAQSPDRPKIHFLLGKPELVSNAKAYGKAKDILSSEHQVSLIEEDEAVNFAESLQAQILTV